MEGIDDEESEEKNENRSGASSYLRLRDYVKVIKEDFAYYVDLCLCRSIPQIICFTFNTLDLNLENMWLMKVTRTLGTQTIYMLYQ